MNTPTVYPPVRILIVDDHPNTAAMLARVLGKFETPVDVVTACSGEDALKQVGDKAVDVLISDFMMPGMNGLELIEKFKGGHEPTHIILITAYDSPGLAITARRLNVQDYLVKPVQPEKIREIVARVLGEIRPSQSTAVRPQPAPESVAPKILIADDYPDNIRLLSVRLQSEGYTPVIAMDGEETLAKVRAERPELVLLDVNMPKKDGFQVLAEIRNDPEIAHIPVIIVTAARIGRQDIREGLTLGADDYITKPFDWREVVARIRSKLRVKRAEDALRLRNQELSMLPQIGLDLSAHLDIEELGTAILQRTVEALGASNANLTVLYANGGLFQRNANEKKGKFYTAGDEAARAVLTTGLTAETVRSRTGMIIDEAGRDERFKHTFEPNVGSAVAVPLPGRHDVIGVLTLYHPQPRHFRPDHLTILQAIASQAAIAVENAQFFALEKHRVDELVALNTLTREIGEFIYSQDLYDRLPELMQKTLAYPVVALWDHNGEKLNLRSLAGGERAVRPSLLEVVPQKAAASGQPSQFSGSMEERTGERAGSGQPPIQSAIAVPLLTDGQVLGVLSIHSPATNAFHESDRVLLETLAGQITMALERIQLFESVEKQQRRLSAVLNGAADAILVLDKQGKLLLANPAGERLFTDVEANLDQPLPAGRGYDSLIGLLEEARTAGHPVQGEIAWPDNRTFSVLTTLLEDGSQVAVLHDVSNFKALDQLKNEWIATATHDLKNPLFAVLGYTDLLQRAGALNATQLEFAGRIRHSTLRMQELVLNLLEIARMDMGVEMNTEDLDLCAMIAQVVEEFRPQANAKNQMFSSMLCEPAAHVYGDKLRLQQAVRNLISNAIKYTPAGGQIVVALEPEENLVEVRVQDTGIGIPPEALEHVFERFYRVQTPETDEVEGNGLGLAIVKSVIEKHHGQVKVESTLGKGSCFAFMLPIITDIGQEQTGE